MAWWSWIIYILGMWCLIGLMIGLFLGMIVAPMSSCSGETPSESTKRLEILGLILAGPFIWFVFLMVYLEDRKKPKKDLSILYYRNYEDFKKAKWEGE